MKKAWLLLIGKSKAETLSKMQTVSPPVTELKGLPGRMESGPFVLSTTIFGHARVKSEANSYRYRIDSKACFRY